MKTFALSVVAAALAAVASASPMSLDADVHIPDLYSAETELSCLDEEPLEARDVSLPPPLTRGIAWGVVNNNLFSANGPISLDNTCLPAGPGLYNRVLLSDLQQFGGNDGAFGVSGRLLTAAQTPVGTFTVFVPTAGLGGFGFDGLIVEIRAFRGFTINAVAAEVACDTNPPNANFCSLANYAVRSSSITSRCASQFTLVRNTAVPDLALCTGGLFDPTTTFVDLAVFVDVSPRPR